MPFNNAIVVDSVISTAANAGAPSASSKSGMSRFMKKFLDGSSRRESFRDVPFRYCARVLSALRNVVKKLSRFVGHQRQLSLIGDGFEGVVM